MKQFTCYLCNSVATSREHVPPRCLFPQEKDLPVGIDLRKNLISVPSCEVHNSEKSKDDEYLMWILAVQIQGNAYKNLHFESKGMRAFQRRPDAFIGIMEKITPVVLEETNGATHESAVFQTDLSRFDRCMWHIAAGLFFHHSGQKWLGGYRVFTDAFVELVGPNAREVNATLKNVNRGIAAAFANEPTYGENKEVFAYKLASTKGNRHAVHMEFYEGLQVSVLLSDV